MRNLLIILTLLGSTFTGSFRMQAQDLGIYASIGVATMRMDDMKYLLESIIETYPVEAKVISSFPPYTASSFGFMKRIYPHLKLGAGYGFTTTGAKANYSDYSGSLTTEITAVSHRLGGLASYTPFNGERFEFSLLGRLDLNVTRMDVSTLLIASGFSNGGESNYTAFSPQVSGYAEILYNTGKFSFGLEGGYLVDLPGKLKEKGGSSLSDPNDPREDLTSDWTGWRAGIKGILWLDFSEN
jgi:hypothetical protein